jgi:hypothetical protein
MKIHDFAEFRMCLLYTDMPRQAVWAAFRIPRQLNGEHVQFRPIMSAHPKRILSLPGMERRSGRQYGYFSR